MAFFLQVCVFCLGGEVEFSSSFLTRWWRDGRCDETRDRHKTHTAEIEIEIEIWGVVVKDSDLVKGLKGGDCKIFLWGWGVWGLSFDSGSKQTDLIAREGKGIKSAFLVLPDAPVIPPVLDPSLIMILSPK